MANRTLNILVAGGFDVADPSALDRSADEIKEFTAFLGRAIVEQGHNLVNGCQTDLDKIVAESASEQKSKSSGEELSGRQIISYVLEGQTPIHGIGTIIQSDLPDWDLGGLQPTPPEVIQNSDVIILIGGFYGTFKAANWSRLAGRPLLPFSTFGGAAKEVYKVEAKRFDDAYSNNITKLEYDQVLKAIAIDWATLAHNTVSLAEKIVTTPNVFIIMSFADSPEYKDLLASIQRVCSKYEYAALRVDESTVNKRIIPEITRQVRQSAFVIADVTEDKANVYYEVGFADGVGKEIILTAKAGTNLPFDINDVPVLFWDSFVDFEIALEEKVKQIGTWQGRT